MLKSFSVDNANKQIRFHQEDEFKEVVGAGYDIGLSLLSFIEPNFNAKDKKHPYIKHFKTDKKMLTELQAKYRQAVSECLDLDVPVESSAKYIRMKNVDEPKKYAPTLRFLHYDYNALDDSAKIQYKVLPVSHSLMVCEVCPAPDLATLCYVEFMKMVQFNLSVRKCQNCGMYFMPKGEYDTKYCDRKPDGANRTCQQIGAVKAYQDRVADNPILSAYHKIYRRFHSRKRHGMITPEQFEEWAKRAKKERDTAIQEDITAEDFQDRMNTIEKELFQND